MLNNAIHKKVLAIILIFTLTFANFAFVTKSYAASITETIFGSNSDTGHKNIGFDAYFGTEETKDTSVISDVNNKDLAINLDLGVEESGYLKNAKIEILESNEEKLSFGIKEYTENSTTANNESLTTEDETTEKVEETADGILNTENENVVENNENVVVENEGTFIEESQTSNTTEPTVSLPEGNEGTFIEEEIKTENVNEISPESETTVESVPAETTEFHSEEVVTENSTNENSNNIENILNSEYVQSLEDNTIVFNQINSVSNVKINLPIEYKNEAYVNESTISNDFVVRFSGIYVDSEGNEVAVEKEKTLTINWSDKREVKIETGVSKYIDFGAGVILQTLVRVDTSKEGNRLPIKSSVVKTEVPMLGGIAPSNVLVVTNSLDGTTGEKAGDIKFDENNWNYNKENNEVEIKVDNIAKEVKASEYSEEFLKEGQEKAEERLYNGNGVDEYLITYTYPGISIDEVENAANLKLEVKAIMSSNEEIENNNNYEYNLGESTGNIVSFAMNNETEEISKAYEYVNYNNNGKYEIEMANDALINVSYKDIIKDLKVEDIQNVYINKEGNEIATEDAYYKKVEISKENFDKILGEAGEIKVKDVAGNEIGIINNDSLVNESGNIELNIEGRFSKLVYEISKPVSEGNLVIRNVRVLGNLSIDKASLITMSKIKSTASLKADYEYVENQVEVERKDVETLLTDTKTEAKIKLDRDSLSTLSLNENVEMRIELNNASLESDIYGHSIFEIELPEYIESFNMKDSKILYGEGLNISNIEILGRTIRVTVDGTQEGINTGVLSNGTNIVLYGDIKVNLYSPAKSEKIKLRYTNDEATNYANNGEDEIEINYSAPTGLVAVNSITGYKEDSRIESVRQGKKTDYINIFAEPKVATEELIIMNNNGNKVSNVSILGRFPFEGVKDILTEDSLKTTLTPRIVTGITADERNREGFKVYYSDNGEATNNIEESSNRWVESPESLENMKSFLIVPENAGYEMEDTEALRFTYQYEIPGNLNHNEYIYGTFMVNCKNNSDVVTLDENEVADLVGLTTGEGPEVDVQITANKEQLKEYEEVELTIKAKNIGETPIENLKINFPVPNATKYLSYENDTENSNITASEEAVVAEMGSLEVNKTLEYKVNLEAKLLAKNGNTGEYGTTIEPKVSIEAKDLGTTLEAAGSSIKINKADLKITEENNSPVTTYTSGTKLFFDVKVENITDNDLNNLVITQEIPKEFIVRSTNITKYDEAQGKEVIIGEGKYDENSRTVTYNIDRLSAQDYAYMNYNVDVGDLSDHGVETKIDLNAVARAEGTEIYESNILPIELAIPQVTATQTTNYTDTYIKDGSIIEYVFTVRNEGTATARAINFEDVLPEGLEVENIITKYDDGEEIEQKTSETEASLETDLEPGETLTIAVQARAIYLENEQEKSISNSARITGENITEIKTNSISNIIESSLDTSEVLEEDEDTMITRNRNTDNNIAKTYKIEGTAWEDANKDGMRNDEETVLSGITVKLVNNDTGVIEKSAITDFEGKYSFTGNSNGNYLVIFEYDTVKYTVTTYQKEGVGANLNSDAIATTIEQDGKQKNGAITDVITINNGSVSGIDMGLIIAEAFDLQLEKSITKITVQNAKGTTTEKYDNAKLAKAEIASKYVSGAVVHVEYEITVKNVGDVPGFAKKIVDYIPEGMKFNSSFEANSKWYTGSDGNLYSTAIANDEIARGESRTIKLVLTKEMTENNTGIVNNLAEIYDDYNIYGISDRNSVPANKAQGENDLGSADSVILIKTGESLLYVSVIITTLLLGTIAVLVVYKKISLKRKEGGV